MLHNLEFYKTFEIDTPENLFKEKNSKFFGYGYPIISESEVKPLIDLLKKLILELDIFVMLTKLVQKQFNIEPTTTANPIILQECQFMDKFNLRELLIF